MAANKSYSLWKTKQAKVPRSWLSQVSKEPDDAVKNHLTVQMPRRCGSVPEIILNSRPDLDIIEEQNEQENHSENDAW